jgi:hypothetical protein
MPVRLPTLLRPIWPQVKVAYRRGTQTVAPLTGQMSRARGGYLPRRSVSVMEDSARDDGQVWEVRPAEELSRAIPDGEPPRHPSFADQLEDAIPRLAIAELPGGRVMDPHRVVIDGRGRLIEELSTYWGTLSWRQHPMYWHPFPDPPLEIPGRLGVLAGRGDHSYYHFLIDILPRLAAFETAGVPQPDRWYAPLGHGFQRQILELAGFLPGPEVIDADLVPHVQAESLLVPGFPDNHLRTPPWAVGFIRDRLRNPELELIPGRRIYITRGSDRNNRTVTNEPEVVQMLGELGFTVIDPGALTVAEQVRAFAEAEWIISPHGAGLANLAFASPGASVIEMFPPDYVQTCYWKLASAVPGLGYRYLVGVGKPPRNGMMNGAGSDITVDLGALSRMLDALPEGLSSVAAEIHR